MKQLLLNGLLAALMLGLVGSTSAQDEKKDEKKVEKKEDNKQSAYLRVLVPADAKLEIEGQETKQTGESRRFESPPVEPGKNYLYTLKITFTENGKPKTREKTVRVNAGRETEVDLRKDDEPKKDEPKKPVETKKDEPKKEEPKKEEPKKEMKKDEPKKEEPKKEDKKDEPKKPAETKKDEPKKEDKKDEPKKEMKKDEPKKEEPKKPAETKKEEPKEPKTIVVPYVSTPEPVVEAMLKMANVKAGDVVYDLGCGDGRIVVTAVKKFGAAKGYGIDLDPERVKDSNDNAKKNNVVDKLTFKQGDVLKLTEKDFEGVDVVTLYLLPEVNLKLKPILLKGLKPGARVVSHDFDMGDDWKAEKTQNITDADGIEHTVMLWTIKGKDDKK